MLATLEKFPLPKRGPRLNPPLDTNLRPFDLAYFLALNAILIVAMWIRHGGIGHVVNTATLLTALGELTALFGTLAILAILLLIARIPFLESRLGRTALINYHRILGSVALVGILAHVVFTTLGYALTAHQSVLAETNAFIATYPFLLIAFIGTGMMAVVLLSSLRVIARHLPHQLWYSLHLLAYLSIVLAFGHQLSAGSDFTTDPLAQAYWIALYCGVALAIFYYRFLVPYHLVRFHLFQVLQVVPENDQTVSVYISGRHLGALRAEAGQHFNWRFLTPADWHHAHPFSLSAVPNQNYLRITIKATGAGTASLQNLQPGTRLLASGPFGTFTKQRQRYPKVLLIAGGTGITPLRALLEDLPGKRNSVVLLYRASREGDVLFRAELENLAKDRQAELRFLIGKRGTRELPQDPLRSASLRTLVPDLRRRDIFLCGPPGMLATVQASLAELQVSPDQIHIEHFSYV